MIETISQLVAELAGAAATIGVRSEAAVAKVAQDTAATARELAPVDTGALRDSIEATHEGSGAYDVGPSVSYAPFVEFGTSVMGPQPFMGPAADAHEAELEAAIAEAGAVF